MRPRPLSRAEFGAAVRSALARLDAAGPLTGSPLLGTALVDPGHPDAAASLRARLLDAVEASGQGRHGVEDHRVLRRTFLTGCPSQEAAAEILDLPFSTYRRHLSQAVDRLTERLWLIETSAAER